VVRRMRELPGRTLRRKTHPREGEEMPPVSARFARSVWNPGVAS